MGSNHPVKEGFHYIVDHGNGLAFIVLSKESAVSVLHSGDGMDTGAGDVDFMDPGGFPGNDDQGFHSGGQTKERTGCSKLRYIAEAQHPMISNYSISLIWSPEDSAYVASIPELPGCKADGKTAAEAVAALEVVATEWIETAKELRRPIPKALSTVDYSMAKKPMPESINFK